MIKPYSLTLSILAVRKSVIKKMLENIYRKSYLKIDEISQELGIPKSLVEQIIQELKNKD